ncbi:MAG TPA: hypothetical protein VF598_06030 [Hymenobacter sp.]
MSPADVDMLTDEKWAEMYADLEWVRTKEAEANNSQKAPTQ